MKVPLKSGNYLKRNITLSLLWELNYEICVEQISHHVAQHKGFRATSADGNINYEDKAKNAL